MFLFPKTMILNGLFDKLSMLILRHVLKNKFIEFGEKLITAKKKFYFGRPIRNRPLFHLPKAGLQSLPQAGMVNR